MGIEIAAPFMICQVVLINGMFFFADQDNITSSGSTYNGQLFLASQKTEPIYPCIKLDGQMLPICMENNNTNFNTIGDSFCRQLGYTEHYTIGNYS